MDYEINLKKISNAFLINRKIEDYDEEHKTDVISIEQFAYTSHDDNDNDDRQALINVFFNIIEYFNLGYQKHHRPEEKFIKISLVDGEHYFDEENEKDK